MTLLQVLCRSVLACVSILVITTVSLLTGAHAAHVAVYLLDEVADIARQSPEAAQALADAVIKKLGAKNPVVKFKVWWLV